MSWHSVHGISKLFDNINSDGKIFYENFPKMTLNECHSKSQFNVFEKWDRKNLDDQLMRIFTETVSTILNFLSKKVSQASSDATLCAVASLDNAYFYFKDGNISLSEREDIRTERTQMDTGCARMIHAWNSAKGMAVSKFWPWVLFYRDLLLTFLSFTVE